jgi:hypothetical protein
MAYNYLFDNLLIMFYDQGADVLGGAWTTALARRGRLLRRSGLRVAVCGGRDPAGERGGETIAMGSLVLTAGTAISRAASSL